VITYDPVYPIIGGVEHPDLVATNWTGYLTIAKFDPSLGELISVSFTIAGAISTDAAFENKAASPETIEVEVTATMHLRRPDLTTLILSIPDQFYDNDVTAYDGVDDFGGTSGMTLPGLIASATDSSTTTNASDLALFTGTGNISLPVDASGFSSVTGSSNLHFTVSTSAQAQASVTYTYNDAVATPEPGPFCLAGSSLLALAYYRRKRRQ
jgi:hypothetical protein